MREILRSPEARRVGSGGQAPPVRVLRRDEGGTDRELRLGGRDVYDRLIAELKHASGRAHTAAVRYAQQVDDAADALKSHVEAKLDPLEGQVTGWDLFSGFLAAFPPTLPYYVAGRTGVRFLDEFATSLASTAEARLRAGARDAVEFGSDVDELRDAVALLPRKAENIASALPVVVTEKFDKPVKEIMSKAPGAWSADDGRFVQPFMLALQQSSSGQIDPIEMDRIIEDNVGLPAPGHAVDFQVDLLRRWVYVFEQKLVAAESSTGSHIEDIVSERQGRTSPFEKVASGRARAAAERRRRELEGNT